MRAFAMGDPQAAYETVTGVLAYHGVLDGDSIAHDAHLISIGDHFDYDFDDPEESCRNGMRVLEWLAAHDSTRCTILVGNHDISRVMELVAIDDATFAAARAFAKSGASKDDFVAKYPALCVPGIPSRDFASFAVVQRELTMKLLLSRRMRLATTARLPDGRLALATHAGVTERELAGLGMRDARDPVAIAEALNGFLDRAVDEVRDAWTRGELVPLVLEPLHTAGTPGEEGSGLLYNRPSSKPLPRRFHPSTLPRGLVQIAGHTGHHKALEELAPYATDAARAHPRGGIRTLFYDGATIRYDMGIAAPDPLSAQLVMIDGEMRRVPIEQCTLLALA